jgi:predicted small lipoprotein YifL
VKFFIDKAMSLLRQTCVILAAFTLIGLITACGQIGPLHLPDKPQPVTPKSDQETNDSPEVPANPR